MILTGSVSIHQLRVGATPLVFEWCMGGALAPGDAQKLSKAVLQK